MDKVEQERKRSLAERDAEEAGRRERFAPGTCGCHEALHVASILTQLVATRLLENAGLVVTPGNGFGEPGEGYFRIALTQKRERLAEAVERIKKVAF